MVRLAYASMVAGNAIRQPDGPLYGSIVTRWRATCYKFGAGFRVARGEKWLRARDITVAGELQSQERFPLAYATRHVAAWTTICNLAGSKEIMSGSLSFPARSTLH